MELAAVAAGIGRGKLIPLDNNSMPRKEEVKREKREKTAEGGGSLNTNRQRERN